jgi:hypothetical protein
MVPSVPGQLGLRLRRRSGGELSGGRGRGGNSANKSDVAWDTFRTAFSKASSVRAEVALTPLTLRTNWRAASSISCVVAAGCSPRSIVILRHMCTMLRELPEATSQERTAESALSAGQPRPDRRNSPRSFPLLIYCRFLGWKVSIFGFVAARVPALLITLVFG